jgi:hypothetical protein
VRHQSLVNLNPLVSLTCQGGNPPPRRERGPRMRAVGRRGPGVSGGGVVFAGGGDGRTVPWCADRRMDGESGGRGTFGTLHAERDLPSRFFGPRGFARLRRLASARALLIGTAARGDCPASPGRLANGGLPAFRPATGPQPRSDRPSCSGHGGHPWLSNRGGLADGRARAMRLRARPIIRDVHRNFVQGAARARPGVGLPARTSGLESPSRTVKA